MSITFNADEIYEMAAQIERNGVKFYREAAGNATDDATKTLLNELADMEVGHEKIFEQMRKELSEEDKQTNTYDPDNQVAMYLQTLADFHGTEGKISPTEKLTGQETLPDILKIALQAEKNSIAFYVGIKDLVPNKSSKDQIQSIIIEEMTHVSILGGKLQAL